MYDNILIAIRKELENNPETNVIENLAGLMTKSAMAVFDAVQETESFLNR